MREKTTGPEDRPHSDDDKGEEQRITSDVPRINRIGQLITATRARNRPDRPYVSSASLHPAGGTNEKTHNHKLTTPEVLGRDGAERGGLSDCVSKTILIVGVSK